MFGPCGEFVQVPAGFAQILRAALAAVPPDVFQNVACAECGEAVETFNGGLDGVYALDLAGCVVRRGCYGVADWEAYGPV